ncbi:MAG TPA: serine/threonine-protein kinase [Polyangiaceae bacterium]
MSVEPEQLEGIPKPGEVLAEKYEVEGVLGAGGMGVVLAARHLVLGQKVAVKFLLPDVAKRQPEAVERFLREARAATQLKSEHVARVMDVATANGGAAYLVMEFLEGQDLGHVLRDSGRLPVASAVDYALQAGEALAEAHARGIIHRDLKPANLFLTRGIDGSPLVKVLDFGISKATATGERGITRTDAVMGSPGYMSPEQIISAKNVDQRSDVWGLGIVLYELVTGVPPFDGDNIATLSAQIVTETPKSVADLRPEAPRALSDVIAKCLEKDAARRFSSMAELATALEPFSSPASSHVAGRIRRMANAPAAAFAPTIQASAAESRALRGRALGSAPTDAAGSSGSARTDGNWERTRTPSGSRNRVLLFGGAAAFGVVALVAFAAGQRSQDEPVTETEAPVAASHVAPVPAPSALPAPAAKPSASQPGADGSYEAPVQPGSRSSPLPTTRDTNRDDRDADRDSQRTRPRTRTAQQPAARCPKGESLSQGHCCKNGLIWLNGRCDRPIATSLP